MKQKKQLTKKSVTTFVVVMVVVLLLIAGRVFVRKAYRSNYKTPENAVSAADWLKQVDGSRKLNLINLPGAHDSATNYVQFPLISQCQYLSVEEQLNRGIRYLDIRLAINEKSREALNLVHGPAKCKSADGFGAENYRLDSLLSTCYAFLEKHPTETIVINCKLDSGKQDIEELQKRIQLLIEKNPANWYTKDAMPQLEEVRGKIVLCRRYEDEAGYGDAAGMDLSWTDMPGAYKETDSACNTEELTWGGTIMVQDHYEYTADNKSAVVEQAYKDANALSSEKQQNTVFLNFLSTKGTDAAFGTPYRAASKINPVFLKMDKKAYEWLGWTIMDYCDEELARAIFETNMASKTN